MPRLRGEASGYRACEPRTYSGVLVISDEIHASLTLPGAQHTPFVSLGGAAAEHGVTLASASKSFNVAGLKGLLSSIAAWTSGDEWLDALLAQLDHARAEFGRLLAGAPRRG